MSDRIDDAIRAELADDAPMDGAILTDWVCIAATYLPGDETANGYSRFHPPGQPLHATLGLLEEARQTLLANAVASLIEMEDDDE